MKKSCLFRNFLLPLLTALAVMCAGSCTKDAAMEADATPSGGLETRAQTLLYVLSDPLGTGVNGDRFELFTTYHFTGTVIAPPNVQVSDVSMMVMSDSNDGFVIERESDYYVDVRFTKPGRYYVDILAKIGMAYQRGGMTCIVESPLIDVGPGKPAGDLSEYHPAD